jgi:predicted metalloprotease
VRWKGGRRGTKIEDRRSIGMARGPSRSRFRVPTDFGRSDTRLQRQAKGHETPESFTHGTSGQRMRWFTLGLEEGTVAACDTFNTKSL